MKHFTKYIYECQKEKRVRNIGFVKAGFEKMSGSIRIQARGLGSGEELSLFLFYPNGGDYEAIFQGKIELKGPMLDYVLDFSGKDMGRAGTTDELAGLELLSESGTCYLAVWNGERVSTEDILQKTEETKEELEIAEMEVEAEELPHRVCEKIQRKDLARLPRKDWYLANNNFLLHGFYNYHHLLWLEDGEELCIGVPGVCHPRECQVADAFGFPEFRRAADVDVETQDENFGYFCRRLGNNK